MPVTSGFSFTCCNCGLWLENSAAYWLGGGVGRGPFCQRCYAAGYVRAADVGDVPVNDDRSSVWLETGIWIAVMLGCMIGILAWRLFG